ncbi:MAG: ABC transporter permease [Bacteroidetes bacterium]|nr:ABC transporter permease [Bacteroidota bacterium]
MEDPQWDVVIDAKESKGRSSFKDLWRYRDLLWLLVRRDFVSFYKQTILGPIWFLIQPIFTAAIYLFVFGNLAGLSSDGIPPPLFYISGITAWTYFSETLVKTSGVLRDNASIFGKVYFPRLIMPLSIIFSNLFRLGIQLMLIFIIMSYYLITSDLVIITPAIFLLPFVIIVIAVQSVGIGLFVSAITSKYRDLALLLGFGLQLLMFTSTVVYPLSGVGGIFKLIVAANPLSFAIELFRFSMFGKGTIPIEGLLYLCGITTTIFMLGLISFNRAEKTFVDTI